MFGDPPSSHASPLRLFQLDQISDYHEVVAFHNFSGGVLSLYRQHGELTENFPRGIRVDVAKDREQVAWYDAVVLSYVDTHEIALAKRRDFLE